LASAVTALIRHGGLGGILQSAEALKAMLEDERPAMREAGAGVLAAIEVKHFHQPLERLLEDPDAAVQLQAIRAAGAMRSLPLVPALMPNARGQRPLERGRPRRHSPLR
ncbi:MAG: HEAT repeat domain-containing protein, partial [Myxococcota bacterium]